MRGWSEDQATSNAAWNDEGEVEEELRIDPTETLPSPLGTPVPLDYLEALSQPSTSAPASTYPLPEQEKLVPREPTTQFLKLIDEVCLLFLAFFPELLKFPNSELLCIS